MSATTATILKCDRCGSSEIHEQSGLRSSGAYPKGWGHHYTNKLLCPSCGKGLQRLIYNYLRGKS